MIADPVILATPAILHHDDRYTVWHAGVVHGPPGLVVVALDIDSTEPTDWNLNPSSHPVDAYIEAPELPWRVVGENGYGADRHTLKFHGRFPGQLHGKRAFSPITGEQLAGARLHIEIHPLDLHLTIELAPQ
ncbi:MAG TPA: hypothetical protein VFE14_06305 [Micromonosporaceae bacterium]|nr:hypothetical protein [Micromonosporaceae bacterium]